MPSPCVVGRFGRADRRRTELFATTLRGSERWALQSRGKVLGTSEQVLASLTDIWSQCLEAVCGHSRGGVWRPRRGLEKGNPGVG